MENLFVILKKKFKIFLKTNLHVLFLLDVIVCCSILYNRILDNKDLEIEVYGSIRFGKFLKLCASSQLRSKTKKMIQLQNQQLTMILNLNYKDLKFQK
jgi:hypothetical protein